MKPRKSKRPGITPSFPALRDELIPVSVSGEAPPAQDFPGSFLSGFSCAGGDPKAPPRSKRGRKHYEHFMSSAVWEAKKRPILRRAGGRCERCPRTGCVLEVHHRNYDRFGGDELESDLEALCPACHAIADAKRRAEVRKTIERRCAEARDSARFRGWLRVHRDYGRDFYDCASEDALREAREEFDEWCSDREEDDE